MKFEERFFFICAFEATGVLEFCSFRSFLLFMKVLQGALCVCINDYHFAFICGIINEYLCLMELIVLETEIMMRKLLGGKVLEFVELIEEKNRV